VKKRSDIPKETTHQSPDPGENIVRPVPYTPSVVTEFDSIKRELSHIMGEDIVVIHHVLSTTVHEKPAQPILNVAVVIGTFEVLDTYREGLEKNGLIYHPEYDEPDRRLFIRKYDAIRKHLVYFFIYNSSALSKHVFFSEYLRFHPVTAYRYARLKQELADRHPSDQIRYPIRKESCILDILRQKQDKP
jgi:GrpB-like predicted nucleotidyltransferase (UPF0157 family)